MILYFFFQKTSVIYLSTYMIFKHNKPWAIIIRINILISSSSLRLLCFIAFCCISKMINYNTIIHTYMIPTYNSNNVLNKFLFYVLTYRNGSLSLVFLSLNDVFWHKVQPLCPLLGGSVTFCLTKPRPLAIWSSNNILKQIRNRIELNS